MTLLEKLAPYLPYDLEMCFIVRDEIIRKGILNNISINSSETHPVRLSINSLNELEHEWMFKPILRPLSDLFKYVDYNDGNGEVMLGYKFGVVKITDNEKDIYIEEVQAHEGSNPVANIDITDINLWLFKYHFDVFGMIEDGLAIDINTLK